MTELDSKPTDRDRAPPKKKKTVGASGLRIPEHTADGERDRRMRWADYSGQECGGQ